MKNRKNPISAIALRIMHRRLSGKFLPVHSRKLMQEISLFALLELQSAFEMNTRRLKPDGSNAGDLFNETLGALPMFYKLLDEAAKKQGVNVTELSESIGIKNKEYGYDAPLNMDMKEFMDTQKKADEALSGVLGFDVREAIDGEEENFQSAMLSSAAWLLILQILILAEKEKMLAALSPKPDYEETINQLDPMVFSIVKTYQYIKESKPKRELLRSKIKRWLSGSKSPSIKKEIFDGFITWAVNLPKQEAFAFTGSATRAAKHYIVSILAKEKPELARSARDKTYRTMCEKLSEHCGTNGIDHPFNLKK